MKFRRLALTALALTNLVMLAACESAALPPRENADVYEFRLLMQPPLVLRWPSGSTIRVFVAGGDNATEASALEAALEVGAAAWNRHALLDEYRLVATTNLELADVVLRWADRSSPVDVSHCVPVVNRGVTTFCGAGNDIRAGLAVFPLTSGGTSRVKMVVTILPSQLPIAGRVPQLVTHELGHVLGIARHSDEARDLMYAGELVTSVPTRRDRATVQVLYQMAPDAVP